MKTGNLDTRLPEVCFYIVFYDNFNSPSLPSMLL